MAGGYKALLPELEASLAAVGAADAADAAAERAPGVCSLPNGAAYYAHKLRSETSTAMSPDEVHALGHEQVGAILGEMAATIARLAAAGDARLDPAESVASNMRRLSSDPESLFADTAEGKAACLQHFRDLVAEIEGKLDAYFDMRPKQPLKIQAVPAHMEEGSPAAFYMPPSLDGSRDGVCYADSNLLTHCTYYGYTAILSGMAILTRSSTPTWATWGRSSSTAAAR